MPSPLAQTTIEELLARARARASAFVSEIGDRLIVVTVAHQRLFVFEKGALAASYPVSTAAAGVGGEAGSARTPPGTHRIAARIGAGEPIGRIFESREPTAQVWAGEDVGDDLILTRILTLDGCEDGVNRGPEHDSRARYIYIHGTNHERRLGSPASHGCVRMASRDVVDLFGRVREADCVVIL